MSESKQDQVDQFRRDGFFVLPAFMSDRERAELSRICDDALQARRSLSHETGHTTPRISLITDVTHAGAERIGAFFSSPRVCRLLDDLALSHEPVPLLKDVHCYHEQTKHDWDGDWHRDSQFGRPDPTLERRIIATTTSLHVRLPLEDDDRLEIVPGSHTRWDTPEELDIRKGAQRARADMPGAVRLVLRAGDACVFHAWTIHRATYRREPIRRTLDAVFGYPPRKNVREFGGAG